MIGDGLSSKPPMTMIEVDPESKIIDMSKIAEECKKKMGTEEDPFEGEVPITKV